MTAVSVSLWLPVSRSNFYSASTNVDLLDPDDPGRCRSPLLDECDYRIRLRVTVLRRLLEVLPRTFGYDRLAALETTTAHDALTQPVSVTVRLVPSAQTVAAHPAANEQLLAAGVGEVQCWVDENGFYVWTADGPDPAATLAALRTHIGHVIGGDFTLGRWKPDPDIEGREAAQKYNDVRDDDPALARPLGILTFFQLNTVFEGLANETLTPAVFFENFSRLDPYMASHTVAETGFRTIGEIADLLLVETDARQPLGQTATLSRFLAITSRESLQKLAWSVESVRRALLDEMMGVLHRQSRLSQLRLFSSEWTPQLAAGATETQLRGYVMLAGAKLPLIVNVNRLAAAACSFIVRTVGAHAPGVDNLHRQLSEWDTIVHALGSEVHGLERAIEQAWMERLLYEQEQVRAQQEVVAEIERSRDSRASTGSSDAAINSLALFLAIVGSLWAIETSGVGADASFSDQVAAVLPVLGIGIAIYGVAMGCVWYLRWLKQRSSDRSVYNYEYTFRLDEDADPARVADYLHLTESTLIDCALPHFSLTHLGGGRMERVSRDKTLVKLHSAITFSVGPFRQARFETVNEIVAHKVAGSHQYVLREVRIFGDSTRALRPDETIEMIRLVLRHTAGELLDRTDKPPFDVDRVVELALPLYLRGNTAAVPAVLEEEVI
ncbi:hypothetical protein F4553_000631 [Allocatelliglobosispora scoriae]|uniref:Uncharacterized protein n=1 Tax=Allocatelliglobosispora scoriae TaxID=643052 RepID=A0A841BKH0_9ACTN|nr:hypothetical protein [Allocatelliglobosispora scoriae]MBB5867252.1 hypothetical protein [Allocatelliglobosispora scoriae]